MKLHADPPMRKIVFNGKEYNCLCDTGACTTVLRSAPPGTKLSEKTAWVKSASGHVTKLSYTKPITIIDKDSGTGTKAPVLVDSSCPVNLLGRDLLAPLRISVVPTQDGGMTTEIANSDPEQDQFLVCGDGALHYWWSLDMTDLAEAERLLKDVKTQQRLMDVTDGIDYMDPDRLHHTLWYKKDPGPDEDYDDQVRRLPKTSSMCLSSLLVGRNGQACATVILNPTQGKVSRNSHPHVSLATPRHVSWASMYTLVLGAQRDHFSSPDAGGWQTGKNSGIRRRMLGVYTPVTPAAHLDET